MTENPEIAFGGMRRLLALIELVYSAVGRPDVWPIVLEEIAELIGGESTCLFASSPKTTVISIARMDPAAWEDFSSYYASINIWKERGDALVADGMIRYSDRLITDAELERTEFYCDYLQKNDMQYCAGVKIPVDGFPPAFISTQRPRSKGVFADREGLVFETILPHMQRALSLHFQFSHMHSSTVGLEAALNAFEHAVLGLDRSGRVVLCNRHAETYVRSSCCVRLTKGRLTAADAGENARLQTLVAEAIGTGNGIGMSSGGAMLLHGPAAERPLRLTITPFGAAPAGSGVQLSALIFLSGPTARPQSRSATLRALYGLTPMEARVADLLLEGLDTRGVSEALGMTLETTRFRVKQILAKTGAGRQSELMRLAMSLPGTAPSGIDTFDSNL